MHFGVSNKSQSYPSLNSICLMSSPSNPLFAWINDNLCCILGANLVRFAFWIMDAYEKARSLAAELAYVGR